MDERKQELIQWMDKLEQYAEDMGLSERIMDRIKECRNDVYSGKREEVVLRSEIEELLESVKKKTCSESTKSAGIEQNVTSQDIEFQMKKMAQRCHDENEKSMDNMAERKNAVVKKTNAQIKEIVNTDAHLDELKHGARYVQFYEKTAFAFGKEVSHIISEMLEDMNHNYTRMLEHLKSLLRGSVGEKAFYELEMKREAIGTKIRADVEALDMGKQEITSFAQKTGAKIKKIVKVEEIKRKLCVALPVMLLLAFFAVNMFSGASETTSDAEAATVEEEAQDEHGLSQFANILDVGSEMSEQKSGENIHVEIGSFLVRIAGGLIAIVLYIFYIKWLKKICDNSVAKKSAEYLQTELICFEQSDCLRLALEEAIKSTAVEYEQQHTLLLNNMFNTLSGEQMNEEKQRLTELLEEWNNVRKN